MGQGKDEVDASPAEIRKAIAKARSELGAHLGALNPLNLLGLGDSPGDDDMPTAKKQPATKASKPAAKNAEPKKLASGTKAEQKKHESKAKAELKSKSSGARVDPKKSDAKAKPSSKGHGSHDAAKPKKRAPKSPGVVAKAGAALDTIAAGAVVGAVKAAARAIDENQVKALKGRGKDSASTAAVLGELAPDAAMGAVVGAAQTVLPVEEKPKGKAASKGGSKSPTKKA